MSWQPRRLKDVAEVLNGFPFDSYDFSDNGDVPLVRIRDILSREFTTFVPRDSVPTSALIRDGDVIIGMDGDFNSLLWTRGIAALNQRLCIVRAKGEADSRFLAYAMPRELKILNDLTYSTTVKHLSSGQVSNMRLRLPRFDQQVAIADYLDRETAQIDTLIAKQERLISLAQERRMALIVEATRRGITPAPLKDPGLAALGSVPQHWQVQQLRRAAKLRNGADYKSIELEEGGYPVYGSGGEFRRASSYLYEGDSVLFGRKGTVDRPILVSGRFWTVDTMFYTEIGKSILPRFLYFYAITMPFDYYATNTAVPSMTQSDLASHPIPLPPLDEQRRIVAYLDEQTAKTDALIAKAERFIELAKERRAALITAAVTGQLDVTAA